jgi:hypothetical protein
MASSSPKYAFPRVGDVITRFKNESYFQGPVMVSPAPEIPSLGTSDAITHPWKWGSFSGTDHLLQ